ncbi:hypothetical protein C8A00DRAFT_18170 [Chaetomidium leptoderma]|uniref:Uncharacterized protein n=1 Tax=Chaetomidium leptoderma TaxID=669021 RepID=A0AAN6VF19_9PEZI|nr:hypothetical protein C8A00DRAFT_18170 [Chaetomidium leptoderma]
MIHHGIIAITAFIASVIAGTLPAERVAVPPPNPIPAIIDSIPNFKVTNFEAKAVMLSDKNYITFHLTPYPGADPAHCFALGTTISHSLTSFPQTWCYHHHHDSHNDTNTTNSTNSADQEEEHNSFTTPDHIWFSWTMGGDDNGGGVFDLENKAGGSGSGGGASLKVVRQVDGHTRDEAVRHIPASLIGIVGEGTLAREMYTGPENFTLTAFRFEGVAH